MNKKLVALAVGSALALPVAAQAQTANVTLYGRLNLDFEFIRGQQADGSNPTVNRVSSNTSRFGLRGTESLGGGLNAIFQLENGSVAAESGGGALAGRETFVGLQGSWGKFTMGKFLMPQDDLHGIFGNSPTLLTSILSTAALWAQGPQSKGAGGFDARTGNSVRYDTPNMSGFTAALQYSTRDSSGAADATAGCATGVGCAGDNGDHTSELRHAWVLGGNIIYANGPLQVGGSFEKNHKVRGATLDDRDYTITGAYDFGTIMQGFGLRLGLVYENTKYETPTGDLKRDFWGASATVPLGGGKIYLFYGRAGNGKGGAADGETVGGLVKGPESASKQWEISYSYSLSPRTLLYTGYTRLNNDCNAKYTFNINAYTINTSHNVNSPDSTPCNGEPQGLVFGMVHFF